MRPSRHTSRAFTLVELLIVISVVTLALVAIIPAFGRIVESANYAASVNRVTSTLSRARALAMESGRQTAVAFLFDIETERTTLQILLRLDDQGVIPAGSSGFADTPASVFIPYPDEPTLGLPRGVGVYAMAINAADENPSSFDAMSRWYPNEAVRRDGAVSDRFWIFPRNDARLFIDDDDLLEDAPTGYPDYPGCYAVSFFVRFSESGAVVSVSSNSATDSVNSYIEYPELPRDPRAIPGDPDAAPIDSPRRFDPQVIFDSGGVIDLNPEVRLRSADMLAIVDLQRLGESVGIPSPWLVRPDPDLLDAGDDPRLLSGGDPKSRFLDEDFEDDASATRSQIRRISRWIDANAEIIGFNRHTGAVLKREAQ